MNKLHEQTKTTSLRNTGRNVASVALSLAAFGGGVTAASAEAQQAGHIGKNRAALIWLQERTDAEISAQVPQTSYNGTLAIRETVHDPLRHKTHTVHVNIENPLIVFNGNPKAESPRTSLTNGNYTFGYIDTATDQPSVTLVRYNPKNMQLIPDPTAKSDVQPNVFFAADGQGGFNWNEAYTSFDGQPGHGGPIEDAAGNPKHIAYAYIPQK